MKAIDIALKDMIRSSRSAMMVAFMFGIPLLVTGLFYMMFGSAARDGGFTLPRTKVVVANLDQDAPRLQAGAKSTPGGIRARTLSDLVVKVLQSEDMVDLLEVSIAPDAASARAAVDAQQAHVAVIIPGGFSRQFADPYDKAVIQLYQDPTLTLGPGIVKSIMNQFMDGLSSIKIALSVAIDELEDKDAALVGIVIQRFMDTSRSQSDDLAADLLNEDTPNKPPTTTANTLASIVGPIMGGLMIFYAFYTGTATAESILREEEEGTLPRLFTTPTSQVTILTGKFLAVFLTVGIQITVLLVAGRLMFGITWGALPWVTIQVLGIVFAASAFGIFVNSLLKDTKQSGLVFGGVLTLTGMLGMIRVFGMNAASTSALTGTVSLLVPQGWAVRGILQTMNGTTGLPGVLNLLVLLTWSVLFFAIGVWRFNRRYI